MKEFFNSLSHIDHIDALIKSGHRESEVLEYKRADQPFTNPDKNEISKDVSAFANSGGGVIIYGVSTDVKDKTKPKDIVGVHIKNVETFDQVINSQIEPPVNSVLKKLIPAECPIVMVVYILPSEEAPHQNLGNHKYYRRAGTESLPMSHDLVALYFGKRLRPMLSLVCKPLCPLGPFKGTPGISNPMNLRLAIHNRGKRIAKYINAVLFLPKNHVPDYKVVYGTYQSIDDLHPEQHAIQYADNVGVIHPGISARFLEMTLCVTKDFVENHQADPLIEWAIYCDEMEPKRGCIYLTDLGWVPPSIHARKFT